MEAAKAVVATPVGVAVPKKPGKLKTGTGVAICGTDVTVDCGAGEFLGHKVSVNLTGTPIDVRHFGSGLFGDWLVCAWTGEIVVSSYEPIENTIPSVATIVVTSANSTMSFAACPLMDIKRDVDAKGIEEFVTTWKIVGNPSIS